jgi:hypothetical protein
MPTGQPTNQPTIITDPQAVHLGSHPYEVNTTYWCHKKHMHSVDNVYQQIFGGLELSNSTDYIKSAKIWSTNWDSTTDSLSMTSSTDRLGNNFAAYNFILTNITADGHLFLDMAYQKWEDNQQESPLGELFTMVEGQDYYWLPKWAWTDILRMASYKWYPTADSQLRCDEKVGTYKEFALQMVDRFDRVSNIYYHRFYIRAAGMIYTDDVAVVTTNEIDGEILMTPDATTLELDEYYVV